MVDTRIFLVVQDMQKSGLATKAIAVHQAGEASQTGGGILTGDGWERATKGLVEPETNGAPLLQSLQSLCCCP